MLCGLSIEVLLKAVILAQTRKTPPKGHDLVQLAANAKWTLSPSDAAPLRELTIGVFWYGKYPAPFAPDCIEIREQRDLQMSRLMKAKIITTPLDWSAFERLRGELFKLLNAACPDGRYPDPLVDNWAKQRQSFPCTDPPCPREYSEPPNPYE